MGFSHCDDFMRMLNNSIRAVELSMIVYEFSDHNMRSRIREIGHSSLHYIFNIAEVPWEWISGW